MSVMPYVVGQWVRGERFYGRGAQIDEILGGPRNWLWLLGTRRVGKTSLLKQLEHLTTQQPDRGYFPIFWDFQGAETSEDLHLDFGDALLDAEERLEAAQIEVSEIEDGDLFTSLARLRRKLRAKNLKLLLLCDEVEELIRLNEKDPALLRKLRRALQSREDIRSVFASSIRLWALAEQKGDTSPFLHGFIPPVYIESLSNDAARALIRQEHLPPGERPELAAEAAETIRRRCDNHPYLLQLVCKRYLELGDVEEACGEVAHDHMVSYFFSVDFEMLSETEREIVRLVGEQSAASSNSILRHLEVGSGSLSGSLLRLENLGFIRRNEARRYILVNHFFRRWLEEIPSSARAVDSRTLAAPAPARESASQASTLARDAALGVIDERYVLLQELGKGASGRVYKAYDQLLKAHIAIKVLKSEYAGNEEALERFRQEILLSRDIGQANILRVYHLGEFDGKKFLTMQLVEGSTLARLIAAEAPLPQAAAVAIAHKLALALEAAHARKVLHRDLKPHNILVDAQREPYVTDFGLARELGKPGITKSGFFLGTPYYASPEQARLEILDERSDIYSLGVVIFEMVTGRRPFEGDSSHEILELHRSAAPPDPRELSSSLSPDFSHLILRCLEKDPAGRYASAGALRQALEALTLTPQPPLPEGEAE